MPDRTYLGWPFFTDAHREVADAAAAWAADELGAAHAAGDVDDACRALVRRLGAAGWLRRCVPQAYGGVTPALDVRTLCLMRETLAHADALADFAFAMQGLGAGPITLFGSEALKRRYLPRV
ncbi:MAG TPA: acyl-CoA dehydrogenase family protein, partial [Longimicrobiaceae bacterium]|nr:acyl-CoA dehydrogenase family protein [Longimicrobiaceae bacterium]